MALLFQLTQKLSQGFAAAWAIWPRKEAKKDAEKAWRQKVTTLEIDAEVHDALGIWVPIFEERDPQYRPLLASWLRGERWNDQPPTPKKVTLSPAIGRRLEDAIQQQDARNRIRSLVALGVEPEDAKEQVYREMGWIKE